MNCPYCRGESGFQFSAMDRNQQTSTKSFGYRICRSCALTFIERIPDNLGDYYVNEQYDLPTSSAGFGLRAEAQRWKVELLDSVAHPGTLLEVGPATGEFAYLARARGYKPTLLEMDENCCKFLREKLQLEVVQTENPAASLETAAHFDVISIWQAIEHIPEYWILMERAVNSLAQGGVMILSTPNPMSLQARLLGRFWPHLDAPRHLYLIPSAWMRAFARKHGLTVVLDTTRDAGSVGLNYYGWYLAVRNAVRGRLSDRWTSFAARRITSLFRRWEEGEEGMGCSYTIALRKT